MNSRIQEFKSYKNEIEIVKNIDGLLVPGQEKLLMVLASKLPDNATIVEIGSFKGKSTACFGLASPKNTKIYAIDTFEGNNNDFSEGVQFSGGNFFKEFKENLKTAGVWKKVKPQIGFSKEIGKKWNKKIDLLFIDGSHLYEDIKSDFELFYPWVKDGGMVALHDVSKGHPGVLKFWNEVVKNTLKDYQNVHTLYFGSKNKSKLTANKLIKDESVTKKVYAIIPVHNRLEFTKKCLYSFKNQSYQNIKVILIDDGSTDGTSEYVKKHYPEITIITGNGNWFWTKSINEGIKYAAKSSEPEDFILTMNNDCYFNKNYITNLVKCSLDNARSITGSFVIDPANANKVLDAGVIIDWENAHIYGIPEKRPYVKDYKNQIDYLSGIDSISGKGALIPIEIINKVGLFQQTLLPHYLADYEFFYRAKTKGINLIVSIKSKLYNYSKETGTEHGNFHHKAGYTEVIKILFSRKSKINIIDHFMFVILRCPRKYLLNNLKSWSLKLIGYVLLLFPFYYIKIAIDIKKKAMYFLKLTLHRIKIKIKQKFFEK